VADNENPLPVVFMTGKGDIPATVRAMRRGAEDFLTKDAKKRELLDAVERALARDARDHGELARVRALRARIDKLTRREREVLAEVVQGRLNKQIAPDRPASTTESGTPT
jgi:FixJ family two-component response regulator